MSAGLLLRGSGSAIDMVRSVKHMIKRIKALALAVLLVSTAALSACSAQPGTTTAQMSKTAVYQVTVLDVDGQPAADGVIVRFLKGGEEVALQRTDAKGVAAKELDRDDYTVEIMFIDQSRSYYYDTAAAVLSATKTELTVELATMVQGTDPTVLFAGGEDRNAYTVSAGRNYVELEAAKRSYFLFTPQEAGVYRLSVEGDAYAVGYYGGPFFVQDMNAGDIDGNATMVTVSPDMIGTNGTGTTVFVIGVDNPENAAATALLNVERVSAYVDTSIPSVTYATTAPLTPWTLPEGAVTEAFDLSKATDAYKLVLDEATGFYHLGSVDGPLVLMCLGEASNRLLQYAASYDTVLQTVGVSKYFTDADGNYTHKEDYSQCLLDYIGVRDYATGKYTGGCVDRATGLYPLTEDLMYIVQQHGDYSGWWEITSSNYLFQDASGIYDTTVNPEIAWLFMCVYIQT